MTTTKDHLKMLKDEYFYCFDLSQIQTYNQVAKQLIKIPLALIGALAPGSAHA